MTLVVERLLISEALPSYMETGADTQSTIHSERERQRWNELIDEDLIQWGAHPEQFVEEDVEPPSSRVIQQAFSLAQALRDEGNPAPDRILRDPNGGIVFRYPYGRERCEFYVWDDGTVEYLRFKGTSLTDRFQIEAGAAR